MQVHLSLKRQIPRSACTWSLSARLSNAQLHALCIPRHSRLMSHMILPHLLSHIVIWIPPRIVMLVGSAGCFADTIADFLWFQFLVYMYLATSCLWGHPRCSSCFCERSASRGTCSFSLSALGVGTISVRGNSQMDTFTFGRQACLGSKALQVQLTSGGRFTTSDITWPICIY